MRRLEHRGVDPEVPARRDAEAADEAGAEVGDDVAVQVREHEDVVELGLLHELHAHVVDDPVLELDVGVLGCDLARDLEPEAVGVLHDVGLVHRGDLPAAGAAGVVEGELHDAARAGLGDGLDRDPGVVAQPHARGPLDRGGDLERAVGAALELDPGVEVLGVLAHDHEVDRRVGVAGAHAGIHLARPHLRVHVERLAKPDVHRAEA